MLRKKTSVKLKFGIIFGAGLIIGAGLFYAGFRFGWYKLPVEERYVLPPNPENKELLSVNMNVFWDSIRLLKEKHFKISEIKDQDLLYGAIKGVVGALDDPYSTFFNPSDAKKFEEDIQGSFGGIGAEIGIRNNQLLIIAPLKGNPAEAAGLKAGDKILKVDDTLTTNLTIEEAVKLIRGEVGSMVTLLILREGWDEAREFNIKRGLVVVPTLDSEIKNEGIVHFKLYNFNANAPQLFYQDSLKALSQGARGVVLDLRNNSGGLLDVATNIAGWFLERGEVIVRERFRFGEERVLRASGPAVFAEVPTVVIVNGGSASASEIVAGALRDNRGIRLVGEKTFGKGTVQEIENLSDGSSIKISVAEWLTPNGTQIEGNGLNPDFEIKLTDEDIKQERDPQLDKALEILEEEILKSDRTLFILGS